MCKTIQFKVDGHWYGYTKDMISGKKRFTIDYKDCEEGVFISAYNTHKNIGNA
jgi:hypothetical protein